MILFCSKNQNMKCICDTGSQSYPGRWLSQSCATCALLLMCTHIILSPDHRKQQNAGLEHTTLSHVLTVRSRDTMFTNQSTLVIWTGTYTRGEKSESHKADDVLRARVGCRQSQDGSPVPASKVTHQVLCSSISQ